MIREHLFHKRAPADPMFRWRGGDISRLEGLSDGVFGVLALMVTHAHRLRDELELDELERFLTIASIRAHLLTVGIAVISILVLVFGGQPGLSGIVYFAMGPAHTAEGFYRVPTSSCSNSSNQK